MKQSSDFQLARIARKAYDIIVDWKPIAKKYNLDERTLTQIVNTWKNHAVVDNLGYIWLDVDGIRSAIRVYSHESARYTVDNFISEYDKRIIDGKLYIRGTAVGKIIDTNIQGASERSKRKYSKISRQVYQHLVDHEICELIRYEAVEQRKNEMKKLKTRRLKYLSMKGVDDLDELTGKKLRRGFHFSHIRSVAQFPELCTCPWNGLLVNSETHGIITKNQIQDEKQLLRLSAEEGWRINWKEPYKLDLQKRGFIPLI